MTFRHPVLRARVAPGTKLVWLYVRATAGTLPEMRINVHETAADLGMSRSTVERALLRLEQLGYLTWQRSRGGGNGDRCGVIRFTPQQRRPLPLARSAVARYGE